MPRIERSVLERLERRLQEVERENADLRRRVADLEAERERLKGIIEEQKKAIRDSERELEEWRRGYRVRDKRYPDRKTGDGGEPSEPRKPGRPVGHPGAGRPRPKDIDRPVELKKPDHCRCCRSQDVRPTGRTRTWPVEELVVRKEVVGYVQYEASCLCCGASTWSPLPEALGPAPKLGLTAQSLVLDLRTDAGLTFGKIRRVLGVLGLSVSKGAVQQMVGRNARRTQASFTEIVEHARDAAVLGMDETGLRHAGRRAWGWLARSEELSLFIISPSRGHEVIVDILGEHFDGTLVVDFYAAYGAYGHGARQFCWPHLIREARRIADLDPCPQTQRFLARLRAAYQRGLELQRLLCQPGRWVVGDHVMRTSLGRLTADPELGTHGEVARLQARMKKHFDGLLTYTGRADVPGHNNGSEQDIRFLVIFRKTSFCTRSDDGAAALAQLLSIGQTLRKQGRTWIEFLPAALAAFWSGRPPPTVFAPRPAGCRGESETRTREAELALAGSPSLPSGFAPRRSAPEAALPN